MSSLHSHNKQVKYGTTYVPYFPTGYVGRWWPPRWWSPRRHNKLNIYYQGSHIYYSCKHNCQISFQKNTTSLKDPYTCTFYQVCIGAELHKHKVSCWCLPSPTHDKVVLPHGYSYHMFKSFPFAIRKITWQKVQKQSTMINCRVGLLSACIYIAHTICWLHTHFPSLTMTDKRIWLNVSLNMWQAMRKKKSCNASLLLTSPLRFPFAMRTLNQCDILVHHKGFHP